ncbi:pentapeptide repeat-containing protein [Anabaena sp. CCY 9910]|uniref:pentapeptide repeat-containing protein n=1 Tax=Anabaena sp. CCY 9910 TaxID=3103870 RepID=UPI0039E1265D
MLQDYSHQNLRGRSFKGQDLAGANFSYADIRGADFRGAKLAGANFYHAKAGRQNLGFMYVSVCSFLFLGLLGFFSYTANYFVTLIAQNFNFENLITGATTTILLVIFLYASLFQGLEAGVLLFIVVGSITVLIFTGIKILAAFTGASAGILIIAVVIVGSIVLTTLIVALDKTIVVIIFILVMLCLIAAVTASFLKFASGIIGVFIVFLTVVITIAIALLSLCISYQAIKENKKYNFIRNTAIALASKGATSFHKADLSNASFKKARLRNVDLRDATLTNTDFYQSQMLDYARLEKTYLQNPQAVNLLVNKQGQNTVFNRQDLRGVNLKGANLTDASFIGSELSYANLQDTNLTRAKLVQTQLDGTDFTGANLTGAYIEDWNITIDTKFDGVRCEYVYMRLPTPDNPDPHRKPDNRQEVFADGEFGDFIKPIFDTLDLYHSQGIDPRAIAISFKQLAENHPEADLRIVGMEVRGEDKFLLRAKTAIAADKSELSAEYFAMYNQLKALAEHEVQKLMAEKDSRIADLQNMVVTALQRPSFYAQTYQNQGDTIMLEGSKQVFNNNLQGAQFAGGLVNADTVNANQIGGNITNYNPEQKQNLAQAAADIQQLLNQLSQTYPTATTSEKMTVVAKAVDEIESNPTLKARVIGALKAGGTEAFKELIDHPVVNILLASIDGWQDAE